MKNLTYIFFSDASSENDLSTQIILSKTSHTKKPPNIKTKKPEAENKDSALKSKQIPPSCPTSQIQKVEQWLTKNKSIQINNEVNDDPNEKMGQDLHYEDNDDDEDDHLKPTQVFNLETKSKYIEVSGHSENKNNLLSIDQHLKADSLSQASTVIFNLGNVQNKVAENEEKHGNKTSEKEVLEVETLKDEAGSEKENEKTLKLEPSDNKKGVKRVLSEPNLAKKTKKKVENVNKMFDHTDDKTLLNPITPDIEAEKLDLLDCEEKKCAINSVAAKASKEKSSLNNLDGEKSKNKRPNVRFASKMKTKLLELAKPSKLMTRSKTKKSPGWSRIEGARRDLKSKHTSLDITGGELKINPLNKTKDSNISVDSSQESVVIIEEAQTQVNSNTHSNTKIKNERFKKLSNTFPIPKGKLSIKLVNASTGLENTKNESFTKTKEEGADDDNAFELKNANSNAKTTNAKEIFTNTEENNDLRSNFSESNGKSISSNGNTAKVLVNSHENETITENSSDSLIEPSNQIMQNNNAAAATSKIVEPFQGFSSRGRLLRRNLKVKTDKQAINVLTSEQTQANDPLITRIESIPISNANSLQSTKEHNLTLKESEISDIKSSINHPSKTSSICDSSTKKLEENEIFDKELNVCEVMEREKSETSESEKKKKKESIVPLNKRIAPYLSNYNSYNLSLSKSTSVPFYFKGSLCHQRCVSDLHLSLFYETIYLSSIP